MELQKTGLILSLCRISSRFLEFKKIVANSIEHSIGSCRMAPKSPSTEHCSSPRNTILVLQTVLRSASPSTKVQKFPLFSSFFSGISASRHFSPHHQYHVLRGRFLPAHRPLRRAAPFPHHFLLSSTSLGFPVSTKRREKRVLDRGNLGGNRHRHLRVRHFRAQFPRERLQPAARQRPA